MDFQQLLAAVASNRGRSTETAASGRAPSGASPSHQPLHWAWLHGTGAGGWGLSACPRRPGVEAGTTAGAGAGAIGGCCPLLAAGSIAVLLVGAADKRRNVADNIFCTPPVSGTQETDVGNQANWEHLKGAG